MFKLITGYENQGSRIAIRRSSVDDASRLYHAYQDKEFIRLFRSNTPKLTVKDLEQELIAREQQEPAKVGFIEFVIEHPEKGVIGLAVLCEYAQYHNRAEFLIGIFDKESRTTGLGVDATLLVLDLAFNHFGLNKVYTYVYDYNNYSIRSTQSIGFTHEATLRSFHYDETRKVFVDLEMFSILLEEFRNNRLIAKLSQRFIGINITHAPLHANEFILNEGQKQDALKLITDRFSGLNMPR